jgi:hypothetical protein
MMNRRLLTSTVKHLRNHPPTGITINAAAIDVKVTADILRAALAEMSHYYPSEY